MKTPIAKADWDRVHDLACAIANAAVQADEALAESHRQALFELLDDLEAKYGRLARLVATRADYEDCRETQHRLWKEAFALAQAEGDVVNAAILWQDLAEAGDHE